MEEVYLQAQEISAQIIFLKISLVEALLWCQSTIALECSVGTFISKFMIIKYRFDAVSLDSSVIS